ncbi:MAG: lactonase family protein [Gemmatimonadetes bacterium]|nr:lactonase family protein [Gemmatimonadota bacterium]
MADEKGVGRPQGGVEPGGQQPGPEPVIPQLAFEVTPPARGDPSDRHPSWSARKELPSETKPSPNSPRRTRPKLSHFVIAPNGRSGYVANEKSNSLTGFAIDPNSGALRELPGSPYPAGRRPIWPAIDPRGATLLVANRESANLSVWRIDQATGVLEPQPGGPLPAGHRPRAVTLTPSGAFGYLLNEGDGTISGYWLESGRVSRIC